MPGGEISVFDGGEYGRAWTFKTEEEADEFVDLVTRKVTAIIDPTPKTPFNPQRRRRRARRDDVRGRQGIHLQNVADVTRETDLDVAAVGGACSADPLRGAGLVDAEALGEDRCREPAGEGELSSAQPSPLALVFERSFALDATAKRVLARTSADRP